MMAMADVKHAFAVCAYGKSPYLPECLASLAAQTYGDSEVFIATSTPSDWLYDIAKSFALPVYVNTGASGIGQDWNFAYRHSHARYVTIAHQDDTYEPSYAEAAVAALDATPDALIYFSDYGELRAGERVDDNRLLRVKRTLLRPLRCAPRAAAARWRKRAALRFGSAICCPAVTFNVERCPMPPFVVGMKSNLDWATWESLSRLSGAFLYDPAVRMLHRIHEDSATSELIASHQRDAEDLAMLERFWPRPVAGLIERFYAKGTESNDL